MNADKNKEVKETAAETETLEELDERDLDQVVGGVARYVHKTRSITDDMKDRA